MCGLECSHSPVRPDRHKNDVGGKKETKRKPNDLPSWGLIVLKSPSVLTTMTNPMSEHCDSDPGFINLADASAGILDENTPVNQPGLYEALRGCFLAAEVGFAWVWLPTRWECKPCEPPVHLGDQVATAHLQSLPTRTRDCSPREHGESRSCLAT